MFFRSLLKSLISFVIFSFIHDHVVKFFYCKIKIKRNNRKKCYFWTCKYYNDCPFNGGC